MCVVCSAAALHKCSACGIARYCSTDHQRKDWARHKKDCRVLEQSRGGAELEAISSSSPAKQLLAAHLSSLPSDKGVPSLQALVDHCERCVACVPATDADFRVFVGSLNASIMTAPVSAVVNYVRSALFRHVMLEAATPGRLPTAALGVVVKILPVLFFRVESFASDLVGASALALVVRLCSAALGTDAADCWAPSLIALWHLGPVSESIDLVALNLLPRITECAAAADVGRPNATNHRWVARHQARTILKDLMVAPSIYDVTLKALQAQFAARPRFRAAVSAVVSAGGLAVFCDALRERDVEDPRFSEDMLVIVALVAFCACNESAWFEQITAAVAASGSSPRAVRVIQELQLPTGRMGRS